MRIFRSTVYRSLAALFMSCVSGTGMVAQDALSGIFSLDPNFSAVEMDAPEVTSDTLLASERFWPYHVSLTEAVVGTRLGPQVTVPAGMHGVLIRVEPDGKHLRIDFGREGLALVPLEKTDILSRANAVRTGALDKDAANLVFMFAPRLVDASQDALVPYRYPHEAGKDLMLMVFADPTAIGFDAQVAQFRSLMEHPEVMTILFPQVQLHDREVRQILRDYDWPVPFLYDHLAEPYTASLLPDDLASPAVMLISIEGRLHFAETIQPETRERLNAVLAKLLPEES